LAGCTFFGHGDCPETIAPRIREAVIDLIEKEGVEQFYVGSQGTFDYLVRNELKALTARYPHIRYFVVLAYLTFDTLKSEPTLFPQGIENVPKRFAISWRNKWMLHQADYVVTYVKRSQGGAAQFAVLAQRQGKRLIKLGSI